MSRADARERVLTVVIAADCDPDRPAWGGTRYDSREPLIWRGVREGVPRARELGNSVTDDEGRGAAITWCLRADAQMKELYGDWAWPAGEFGELWRELREGGDEMGWHPHLWRWSESGGGWYQETEDEAWIRACLAGGYAGLAAREAGAVEVCRMGGEFHSNQTMAEIERLGVRVDCSAAPGRYAPGGPDRWGSSFHGEIDWRGTGDQPYVPAVEDYRRPAREGEAGRKLVEAPLSTFRSLTLSVAAGVRARLRGRRLRPEGARVKAYATAHPAVFRGLVVAKVREAREQGEALLVTAFHPDELLAGGNVGERMYGAGHLKASLEELKRRCGGAGVKLRFAGLREAVRGPVQAWVGAAGSGEE